MLASLLALGFLVGLKHALEADHLAAVTALATRSTSMRETAKVAGAWGVGHAGILVIFGTVLVVLGTTIPENVARILEGVVGVMLFVLGLDALRRMKRRKLKFHVHHHDHGDGVRHAHLHVHSPERPHHAHVHARSFMPRALVVGGIHGMSGTAALVLLAIPTMKSGAGAFAYLVVFGLGTIAGMVLFSLIISVPLAYSVKKLRRVNQGFQLLVGLANVALGLWIAFESLA